MLVHTSQGRRRRGQDVVVARAWVYALGVARGILRMTSHGMRRGLILASVWMVVLACGRTPIGGNGSGDINGFVDEQPGDGDVGDGDIGDGDIGDGDFGDGDFGDGDFGDGDFGDGDFGDGDFGDGDDGIVQPRCGNGLVQPGEQCDGTNLNGQSCRSIGLAGGTLRCNRNCTFDANRCERPAPDRFFECVDQTAAFVPSDECAERLCNCNLNATEDCGPECWRLLRCATNSCGGNGDDLNCIFENCPIQAANEATAMRRCLEANVDACLLLTPPPPPRSVCGNGIMEPGEACDRTDLGGLTCNAFDLVGRLRCDSNCRLRFDGCSRPEETCGNGVRDIGEECDPAMPFSLGCSAFNLGGGAVGCTPACRFDFSGCQPRQPCGNGVIEPGERCDRTNLGGASCATFGLRGDGLRCNARCQLDPSACETPPVCGNGVTETTEQCDGMDLNGQTCLDFGFTAGSLACTPGCDVDLSGCERCGDDVVGPTERCDGPNLSGQTCRTLGYTGGALACGSDCQFDVASCALCGNGLLEPGEGCDTSDLNGATCQSLGLGDGTLACDAQSCLFDTALCQMNIDVCGNGVTEPGEQCDGMDLASNTCETLGYDEGSLSCNAATCRFNVSQCRDVLPPEPPSCATCSQDACAEAIDNCQSDPGCIPGLRCLATRCGNSADLSCALQCFGNTGSGFAALSMFSCVVSQCGASCVGGF